MTLALDPFKLVEIGLAVAILLVFAISYLARALADGIRRWWSGPAD